MEEKDQTDLIKKKEDDNTSYYEMWGEHISFKQLLIAILINVVFVIVALVATTRLEYPYKLLSGLVALVLAAFVCSVFIKPKRNLKED